MCQAGNHIFTLPICLRNPRDPGYPLSDDAVFYYFKGLPGDNDLSVTAHVGIACFLGALHETTLGSLERIRTENRCDGPKLRSIWHGLMENDIQKGYRPKFFESVIQRAKQVSHPFLPGAFP